MLSDTRNQTLTLEQDEKVVLLTELRSIFMLAQQGGCKDLQRQYPKLNEFKGILDVSHSAI